MANLQIGTDIHTSQPVTLSDQARTQGVYIIGLAGKGKTTLLANMIKHDMDAGHGLALLDPHGDATLEILPLVPPHRRGEVLLLDAGNTAKPFSLNLLEATEEMDEDDQSAVVESLLEAFHTIYGEDWGPRLETVMRACAWTIVQNPGFTLVEIPELFRNDGFRNELLRNVTEPMAQTFWESYAAMRKTERDTFVESTRSRVFPLITNPTLRRILGQEQSSIDCRRVIDEGQIVFLRLPVGKLGSQPVSLLGSLFVSQLLRAATSREDTPREQRRFFALYADEFQRFATPDFGTFFNEARKYNIGLTVAHQQRGTQGQLAAAVATAVLGANNKIVFGISGVDAEELAKEFDHTPPAPEATGSKPKIALSHKPFQAILDRGHPSQEVVDSARTVDHLIRTRAEDMLIFPTKPAFYRGYYDGWLEAPIARQWESKVRNAVETLLLLCQRVPRRASNASEVWEFEDAFADQRAIVQDLFYSPQKEFFHRPGFHLPQCEKPFIRAVVDLAFAVGRQKVMETTTEFEPIYGSPRTYADVQNEVASKLANLPPFTARCKLVSGEYTVRMEPFPQGHDTDDWTVFEPGKGREEITRRTLSVADAAVGEGATKRRRITPNPDTP